MIGACVESQTAPVIQAAERSLDWSKRTGANNLRAHVCIFHAFGCMGGAEFDPVIISSKTKRHMMRRFLRNKKRPIRGD